MFMDKEATMMLSVCFSRDSPSVYTHSFLEINTFNLTGLANIKDKVKNLQWCVCPGTPETM